MRDYDDDNIWLYTPALQRIIILVAVIIAVPAMMWTITSIVHSYVAPPKVPTFQRMTDEQPSDTASDVQAAATAPASQQVQVAASPQMADASASTADARTPLLEIKKPATSALPQTPAAAGDAPAAAPTATAAPRPTLQPTPTVPAQPPVIQPTPALPSAGLGSNAAMPPEPTMATVPATAAPDSTVKIAAVPAPSDHPIVWPNPQSNAPPEIATDAASASHPAPAPQPQAANDSTDEESPAANPIAGPIPLPRQRPNDVAMLQPGVQGPVPLPRARPADAPAGGPETNTASDSSYDPGMQHY